MKFKLLINYLLFSVCIYAQETILYPSQYGPLLSMGKPVAASEHVIAFGAVNGNPNFQSNAGAVYIFEKENMEWIEKTILIASDAGAFDQFGSRLEVSDEYIIAGTPLNDNMKGGVYVFSKVDGEWIEETKLTASDAQETDGFGFSLAFFDGMLAVGAYSVDVGSTANAGAVYLYQKHEGEWVELEKIPPPEPINSGFFGYEVAMNENFLFVTGRYDVEGINTPGRVISVYERSSEGWILQQQIFSTDSWNHEILGNHIEISGDRFITNTAIESESLGTGIGAVLVYEYNDGFWEKVNTIYPDGLNVENIGSRSLSLKEARLAFTMNNNDLLSGTIYIYELDDSEWEIKGIINPVNSTVYDQFGKFGVSLLANNLVTSASGSSFLGDQVGAGYIYDLDLLLPAEEPSGLSTPTLSIYPNPTMGLLQIKGMEDCTNNTIEIYDVQGQLLQRRQLTTPFFSLEDFAAGLYLVRISTCRGVITKKVILQD